MKSLLTLMAVVLVASLAYAEEKHDVHGHHGHNHKHEKVESKTEAPKPANDICPVMGEKVNPKLTVEYKGELIGLCCKTCVKEFKKNPEKYMKKLKRREEASAKPINKTCPVMGGKVNPELTTAYKGKTIGFCCAMCPDKFKKDPEKYMKKLLEAEQ